MTSELQQKLEEAVISYKGICPRCKKGKMIYKIQRKENPKPVFLGCSTFPDCRWTSYSQGIK